MYTHTEYKIDFLLYCVLNLIQSLTIMHHKEVHGISSSNTIRRVRRDKYTRSSKRQWGYTARVFDIRRKKARCFEHGHRMCNEATPDWGATGTKFKKRLNNKKICEEDYLELSEEFDSEVEEINSFDNELEETNSFHEINDIDVAYNEYEKMRNDEIDLHDAYVAYEKMKEDEWIVLTEW